MRRVWIDTDPSIGLLFREVDDAFALILAFHSPELRIAGISTTYGNAALRQTTRIARDLVARFGGNRYGVYAGARCRENLGRSAEATEALAAALHKGRLTYIALGPLTNLATLVRSHPELSERIDEVIFVGGQTSPSRPRVGRWLTIHDANVFKDPVAAEEVLKCKFPISLAPIETSVHLQVTSAGLKRIRQSAAGEFLYRHTRLWSLFWRKAIGFEGGPIFDALPVLALIPGEFISSEWRGVSMENGTLLADSAPSENKRAVRFYSGFNRDAMPFICRRISGE